MKFKVSGFIPMFQGKLRGRKCFVNSYSVVIVEPRHEQRSLDYQFFALYPPPQAIIGMHAPHSLSQEADATDSGVCIFRFHFRNEKC